MTREENGQDMQNEKSRKSEKEETDRGEPNCDKKSNFVLHLISFYYEDNLISCTTDSLKASFYVTGKLLQ